MTALAVLLLAPSLTLAQGPVQNPFAYYRLLPEARSACAHHADAGGPWYSRHLLELLEGPRPDLPALLIPGNKRVWVMRADASDPRWAEVCYGGYNGWVQADQLTQDAASLRGYVELYAPLAPFAARVRAKTDLRSLPPRASGSTVIARLAAGEALTALSGRVVDGHLLVNTARGQTGWARQGAIRRTGAAQGDAHADLDELVMLPPESTFSGVNVPVTVEYTVARPLRIFSGHRRFTLPPCKAAASPCSATVQMVPYTQWLFATVDGAPGHLHPQQFAPGERYRYVFRTQAPSQGSSSQR